jgi:large subunit ribosomal protein L23
MADEKKSEAKVPTVDPWTIILHPLLTEKAIGKIEKENRIIFVAKRTANKSQIKWAVEKAFSVKVDKVNTIIDRKGRKKAWVKLAKEFSAADIATKMGML